MTEMPTLPIDLAGWLKVDPDAHTARCEALARTWVNRMLVDAGISADDIADQVDADELVQAILAVGADLYAQRKHTSGQGDLDSAETTPTPNRDARTAARVILRDYLGLGIG